MEKTLKLRVILDSKEDVFRDIEIKPEQNLEKLSVSIVKVFGINPGEVSAFYLSDNDWTQGEEIPLFDMGMGEEPTVTMKEVKASSVLNENKKHLLFVYDFLNMWTFFVEFIKEIEIEEDDEYPRCVYNFGETPAEAPDKDFGENVKENDDLFGDAFDDEEEDEFY